MAYIQVEASVRTHRKFLEAGPAASWLWLCCVCYCSERDQAAISVIEMEQIGVADARRLAARLVKAGLLNPVYGGWAIPPAHFKASKRRPALGHLFERLAAWWGRACAYCHSAADRLEIEHIVPRSRGGTDVVENLTLSCRPCNQAKRTKTAAEFGHPEVHERAIGIR